MRHDSASTALLDSFDQFGIEVTPPRHLQHATAGIPIDFELRRRRSSRLYTAVSVIQEPDGLSLAQMNRLLDTARGPGERRLLVVAERLNARTMKALRARDIDYIDLVGNALIRFGDVYIDVQGKKTSQEKSGGEKRHAPVNLFSARRAQVTFALIVWPELFTLPLRYTSQAAGVSMGIAFQTLQLLIEAGYVVDESNPRVVRRAELIDRWTDAFMTGLRNKLTLARYRGEHLDVVDGDYRGRWFISGESAVRSLLRPTTLTVYVDELDPKFVAANRWRRDGYPNIEVRKKFWKDPRQILHHDRGLEFRDFTSEAPALLIYADLMASGDGRQREAAQLFRKAHLELVDR